MLAIGHRLASSGKMTKDTRFNRILLAMQRASLVQFLNVAEHWFEDIKVNHDCNLGPFRFDVSEQ